ncbi:hypothetical protein BP6252_06954 [Coleophoma cylindrospora]|uniref:2EXR domain-containing protein n=1 Tax=Coleophoma cylindrospora TaxID=1849047 RepID=A0A3D8RG85_9HELO|nr:hypothetical protein BP6252_06954 [Coleophoma cylindrospora]
MSLTCGEEQKRLAVLLRNSLCLSAFTVFPLLPKEIRLRIWDFALIPRVISIARREDVSRGDSLQFQILSSASDNPSVIWIALACAESFRMVNMRYHEWFIWDFFRDVNNSLISPLHDVIYLPCDLRGSTVQQLHQKFTAQTAPLRTIALSSTSTHEIGKPTEVLEALHDFPCLKELVIVKTNAGKDWGDANKVWQIPQDILNAMEILKKEKWPDWEIPLIRVVTAEGDALC